MSGARYVFGGNQRPTERARWHRRRLSGRRRSAASASTAATSSSIRQACARQASRANWPPVSALIDGEAHPIVEAAGAGGGRQSRPRLRADAAGTQIATLVAHGQCTKRIAFQLHISEWTVHTHLRRIYAKLGVAGRAEMVFRCASRLGAAT